MIIILIVLLYPSEVLILAKIDSAAKTGCIPGKVVKTGIESAVGKRSETFWPLML